MMSFREWLNEAWVNEISKGSREVSVTSKNKYDKPTDFKAGSKKLGELHGLELHQTDDGKTHFTWSPKDRMIHHVVHAAMKDSNRLSYLSAHKRDGSAPMGDIYHHLVTKHGIELAGTGHSPGAQKMWAKFHDHPDLEVHGHDPVTGDTKKLAKTDPHYAPRNTKDPEEKKVGRMHLILKGKK